VREQEFLRNLSAWDADAACRGRGQLFFSEDEFSQRLAQAICRDCPVRPQCEAEARAVESPGLRYGVIGGYTPEERARWR
jgi:predicted RecB family nuclease